MAKSRTEGPPDRPEGTLIIIGGHENKAADQPRDILERVAQAAKGKGPLVVTTVASTLPAEEFDEYQKAFRQLGVEHVDVLGVRAREEAYDEEAIRKIENAAVVFFTGGDQLRITSQVGDSPVFQCLQERYRRGMTVAGTSAGAAAMPETMLISGAGDESYSISALGMAPGLGLISGVVTDSHFAARGRFGRLLGAVAENPKNIGLGIDENTAIVVGPDRVFEVIGSGGVYVIDGTGIEYTSLSEKKPSGVVTIVGTKLHVLAAGDRYDLEARRPLAKSDPAA